MSILNKPEIILHKYYLNANTMYSLFDHHLQHRGPKTSPDQDPQLLSLMALWYGCLYVVVEGWKDTNSSYPPIDELLQSHFIDELKGFRHDTFHYQNDYTPSRFIRFISQNGSAKWVRALHEEFGRYLLKEIKNQNLS